MLRALTANLVAHERIETTDAKAKELRRVAERLITRAIRLGSVAYTPHDRLSVGDRARRRATERQVGRFLRRFAVVQNGGQTKTVDLVEKVFLDLAKRFKDRPGGYTRIVKLGRRRGDNAPMSLVEFVERPEAPKPRKSDERASRKKKAEPEAESVVEVEPEQASAASEASEASEDSEAEESKPSKRKAEAAEAESDKPAKKSRKKAEPKAGESKPKKTAKKKGDDE